MNSARWTIDRLHSALVASGDLAYDWDLVTDRIDWFDGALDAFGLSSMAPVANGGLFNDRIHPDDREARKTNFARACDVDGPYECEYRVIGADQAYRWFHDRGAIEFDRGGRAVRVLGVLRQIAPREARSAGAEYLAHHDPLTGHYNRARLREALDHTLDYADRYHQEGAYLVVGIDKLTLVNQAFGHEIADAVIVALGDRMDRCVRASDIIGRVDGDRFGVVLSNCPNGEAGKVAQKILEMARETVVDTPAGAIHFTVSIGVVTFPDLARTAPEAMTKADIALGSAKQRGRDCLVRYNATEEQRTDHRRTIFMAEQVQRALRENRLRFAYQPVVDAQTLQPKFHECLLRLVQPNGDVLSANDFVPVVESLGMVRAVDRRVMEIAVEELAETETARLAINVSGLTTCDRAWLRSTVALLRGRPEIAERVIVEITETAGLEDLDACARFVSTLRDLGCRVALDDFGAGYTSFRHLKQLAVNIVKIDGSFIRKLHENEENLIFVRTLLDLARSFNLTTVAEWVETMDEVRTLRNEGVHLLQGFAFGIPGMVPPWEEPPQQLSDDSQPGLKGAGAM